MQNIKTRKFQEVFQKLKGQIPTCKICFRDIKKPNICWLIGGQVSICEDCLAKFDPKFVKFKSSGVKCLAIFDYDDFMKDLIYQFKGCYDYELKDIFIKRFSNELSLLYKGYTMIPAPSFKEDNLKRGFNHVQEIFKSLKLEMVEAFEKTEKFKQAEHSAKGRKKINKFIRLKDGFAMEKKKVLIVDDIYTTGSTFNTMVCALKSIGIIEIKGLFICKTKLK